MRRILVLVSLLLLGLAPAAAAQGPGCGGSDHHVETLEVSLAAAPTTVPAGRPTAVPVTVMRGDIPVADALVYLRLRYGPARNDVSMGSGRTGADGRVQLVTGVPRQARGALTVRVSAYRPVFQIPCYGSVEEYGTVEGGWGRAVS